MYSARIPDNHKVGISGVRGRLSIYESLLLDLGQNASNAAAYETGAGGSCALPQARGGREKKRVFD